MLPAQRDAVANAVVEAWMEGRLEPQLCPRPTRRALSELRHALAATVATLRAAGWHGRWERFDGTIDEGTARRWCWIEPWLLMSQDEDLFLMEDGLVVPLLEEAADGCTKRECALAIVAHHARDRARAALDLDDAAMRATLAASATWFAAARAARAPDLAAYLERLAGYAEPRPVTEEDARSRAFDLSRCAAPTSVQITRRAQEWIAEPFWGAGEPDRLIIGAKRGDMRTEPSR